MQVKPLKPWISQKTLELIQLRNDARLNNQAELERHLKKQIRIEAKNDRAVWIEKLLESGDWKAIKQHRAGPKRTPGRLKNADGQLGSEDGADTMAIYLSDVVWKIP